jgi:hypothetical protein
MESQQHKLRETEAIVVRQQQVKRVSQFKMQKIESGGTTEFSMAIAESSVGEGMRV